MFSFYSFAGAPICDAGRISAKGRSLTRCQASSTFCNFFAGSAFCVADFAIFNADSANSLVFGWSSFERYVTLAIQTTKKIKKIISFVDTKTNKFSVFAV